MNGKRSHMVSEIIEIFLSVNIIIPVMFILIDWKKYEICFITAFGFAAVLLFFRGVRCISSHSRGHFFEGVLYIAGTVIMIAFLVGSALTIWGDLL